MSLLCDGGTEEKKILLFFSVFVWIVERNHLLSRVCKLIIKVVICKYMSVLLLILLLILCERVFSKKRYVGTLYWSCWNIVLIMVGQYIDCYLGHCIDHVGTYFSSVSPVCVCYGEKPGAPWWAPNPKIIYSVYRYIRRMEGVALFVQLPPSPTPARFYTCSVSRS